MLSIIPDDGGIVISFCCLNYVSYMPSLVIEGPAVNFCRVLSAYLFLVTSEDNFRLDFIAEPWLAVCNHKLFCFKECMFI